MTSSFEKYATGALIGGVVGAVMGLLFAPRSGAETRKIIRQEVETKSREAAGVLQEKSEVIKKKAAGLKEVMVDMSTRLEEKGKETIDRFKEVNDKATEATS
ncbi:MAG TPA: YtxH domain-containing protein [Coleofasciculaceae cyanobacterium]|jgi:gas vesicle protein